MSQNQICFIYSNFDLSTGNANGEEDSGQVRMGP